MNITLGQQGTIEVVCRSRLADWDNPRVRRYNNQTQQALYPGDLGLEFVEQATEKEIFWGVKF